MIEDQIPGGMPEGKCLSQLLGNPKAVWMSGHVEMQNASPIMSNHKEAVENTKRKRRDGKEIHRGNGFAMIV
jgi:hypothetical protein